MSSDEEGGVRTREKLSSSLPAAGAASSGGKSNLEMKKSKSNKTAWGETT